MKRLGIETEIAVLYNNLRVVRVPWVEKLSLRRDNVLALAVLNNGKRNQCSILHDYYQLIWTDADCCLTGHDGDYGFYSLDEPNVVDWRFPFVIPENCIEFEGVYVDKEDWQRALEIYADPDGGMF